MENILMLVLYGLFMFFSAMLFLGFGTIFVIWLGKKLWRML